MKKALMLAALAVLSVLGLTSVSSAAYAAGGKCPDGKKEYQHSIAECSLPDAPDGTPEDLNTSISNLLNVAIGVVGVVAIIVMIVGGVFFLISQGDSSKITRARHTVMYGVIGLVIALLAFAIVNFVIAAVAGGAEKEKTGAVTVTTSVIA